MGEVESNLDNIHVSGSDVGEEQCISRELQDDSLREERSKMQCEEQVNILEQKTRNYNKGERTRQPEKRLREESEESIDDDDFTTITRKKRLARSFSKKSSNPSENDLQAMEQKYIICVTSKEELPKQFAMAKLLRSENIQKIMRIQYKNRYRVLITLEDKNNADKLLNNSKFKELDYRSQSVHDVCMSYGIVKQVDLEINISEIKEDLKCDSEIASVMRLKRQTITGEWVDSETVRICFQSSTLPPFVYSYGCRFKVEPYTFPVTQCSRCWRYGHLARTCPSNKVICPKCGGPHDNCEVIEYKCINCKGRHMALNKTCPAFLKEKEIRKIMSKENCTYRKALLIYLYKYESKEVTNHEEIIASKQNVLSNEVQNNNMTMSYRDVLETKAVVHREMEYEEETEEEQKNTTSNYPREKGKKKRRKKNINNETKERRESVVKEDDKREKPHMHGRIMYFLHRIKDICLNNSELKVKIELLFQFILREIKDFVVRLVKESDIFSKLINLLYNDQ